MTDLKSSRSILANVRSRRNPGVADGDVDAAPIRPDFGDHAFHLRKIGDVDLERAGDPAFAAQPEGRHLGFRSEVGKRDPRTARGESARIAQAKTSGGPGDDGDLVLERYAHRLS